MYRCTVPFRPMTGLSTCFGEAFLAVSEIKQRGDFANLRYLNELEVIEAGASEMARSSMCKPRLHSARRAAVASRSCPFG